MRKIKVALSMKRLILVILVAMIIGTFSERTLEAATVEIPLPLGDWWPGRQLEVPFDLGAAFQEIDDIYFNWSGDITAGLCTLREDTSATPWPVAASFYAYVTNSGIIEVEGGESTYPNPESFNSVMTFSGQPWPDLLDGTGVVTIELYWTIPFSWLPVEEPSGTLDHAALIIDGTLVPEPSIATLLCAALAVVGLRSKKQGS